MAEMLSQAEIDALLGGSGDHQAAGNTTEEINPEHHSAVTSEEKDILGEIGNISMGTSATTLSTLLNQRVSITTPIVKNVTWDETSESYTEPCVGVQIDYTAGIKGTNILILVNQDVKTIANLMMGGDGKDTEDASELTDLDLSAISEAMNQMVGSASTSLASMIGEKIDIATPRAFLLDFENQDLFGEILKMEPDKRVVAISFHMQVGDLIDSEIVYALPIEFAVQMAEKLKREFLGDQVEDLADSLSEEAGKAPPPQNADQEDVSQPVQGPEIYNKETGAMSQQDTMQDKNGEMTQDTMQETTLETVQGTPQSAVQETAQDAMQGTAQETAQDIPANVAPSVNAQPVQFQSFDFESAVQQKENIGILMDVPLEVTVELGKTSKKIKEILEFSPGTIIELDKLAGEPIDILVNGKYVAKGEVVVIDENFAIRVTNIISSELRV